VRIFDTLSTEKKDAGFGDRIRIYLCGVTVYDDSHIGHARTVIVFDVLRRYLESCSHTVELVQNFTDVDDKIIGRAREEGVGTSEISSRYIRNYHRDSDRLRVKRAASYPRATEHMPDMILLSEGLTKRGTAYVAATGVYFAVSKFPEYGKLSKKRTDELQAGARVEVSWDKRDPLDFALWKFADSEPRWDSPWGAGRPGWHIECSAMSLRYLGAGFDIHGGGRDLIFPHHENEIAQSEANSGGRLARIWMHVGMVTIGGEKMSKSLGNIKSVEYVTRSWGPNVIRLFCLSGHYSKPIDYSEDLLKESLIKWRQVETAYYEMVHAGDGSETAGIRGVVDGCRTEFGRSLEDDFDTHGALSAFFRLVREINRLAAGGLLTQSISRIAAPELERYMEILGLHIPRISKEEVASIDGMIAKREELRRSKRYGEADRIRDEIQAQGVELIDHGTVTSWVKRERVGAERAWQQ